MFPGGQPRLLPKGLGISVPKFFGTFWTHTYAQTVGPTATKCGTITHGEWCISRDQLCHPCPRVGASASPKFLGPLHARTQYEKQAVGGRPPRYAPPRSATEAHSGSLEPGRPSWARSANTRHPAGRPHTPSADWMYATDVSQHHNAPWAGHNNRILHGDQTECGENLYYNNGFCTTSLCVFVYADKDYMLIVIQNPSEWRWHTPLLSVFCVKTTH